MKTSTEIKFDYIVRECYQIILKPLGFKKKGNNFYLVLNELTQVINFQKSTFYSKEYISFTINIGIFIPEYWLTYFTYHNGELPLYPRESMSAIRQRIGQLKHQNDEWFDISKETDTASLATEMIGNVNEYILPYLQKARTRSGILQLLENKELVLDIFTRLIIYGEYKVADRAQAEYDRLKEVEFVRLNFRTALDEYRLKYHLSH